jgi:SAM-dependent methyltransferase
MFYKIFSFVYRSAADRMANDCRDFINDGDNILDLGCGSAIVAKKFKQFFQAEVTGIDIIDNRVEKIDFRLFNGLALPFESGSFDNVLIAYVLHHCQEPLETLSEAKRVAKRHIIIYEDMPDGWWGKIRCRIHGNLFNIFFQKNSAQCKFLNQAGWGEAFKKLGLKPVFEKKVSLPFELTQKRLFVLEKF